MVDDILTRAGVPYRRTRFIRPPDGDYAIYMDYITADGADETTAIYAHDVTIELYERGQSDAAEQSIESELIAAGLHYTKQDRYWLSDVQRYQVVYEFTYYSKRRN